MHDLQRGSCPVVERWPIRSGCVVIACRSAAKRCIFSPSKEARDGGMVSQVDALAGAARVEEIARMLGGIHITAATRKHAEEMLLHALHFHHDGDAIRAQS